MSGCIYIYISILYLHYNARSNALLALRTVCKIRWWNGYDVKTYYFVYSRALISAFGGFRIHYLLTATDSERQGL